MSVRSSSSPPLFVPFSACEPPINIVSGPPAANAPHVLAFCGRINPNARPVRLAITPEASCEVRECFQNVRRKVEREGGRIKYGWALWEWPRVFIEAEHHAVYEGPDATSWLDITPSMKEDPQTARLFLPDDSAVYDFEKPDCRRDNIRQALAQDPLIEAFLRLPAELTEIMNRIPGQGMVTISGSDAERVVAISKRMSQLKRQLAMKYTPQGAPCFCGSGEKFKRCHGV